MPHAPTRVIDVPNPSGDKMDMAMEDRAKVGLDEIGRFEASSIDSLCNDQMDWN